MTIVKNKHYLIAWIHRFHTGSTLAEPSSSEGAQTILPGSVLVSSVVSATASGPNVLGYARHLVHALDPLERRLFR